MWPLSGRALAGFVGLELLSLPVLWQPVATNPTIASKKSIFFIVFYLIRPLLHFPGNRNRSGRPCVLTNCKNYAMRFAVDLRGF